MRVGLQFDLNQTIIKQDFKLYFEICNILLNDTKSRMNN